MRPVMLQVMRWQILLVLECVVLVGSWSPTAVFAQAGDAQTVGAQPLNPLSRDPANRFNTAMENAPHRTKAIYLPKGASIDLKRPQRNQPSSLPLGWGFDRWAAVLTLLAIAGLLLVWLWRSGILAALLKSRKEKLVDEPTAGEPSARRGKESEHTPYTILQYEDPREGLQAFVSYALVRSAQAASIPLRRSLTGREILRRLPKSFVHREAVSTLLRRSEPVLFGEDVITHDGLSTLLDDYKVLFEVKSYRSRKISVLKTDLSKPVSAT
ncbi:MAG: hypothetical protein AAF035_07775 [Pseudomonadota bacterium]